MRQMDKPNPTFRNTVTITKYNTINSNSDTKSAEGKNLLFRGETLGKKRCSLKEGPTDMVKLNVKTERRDRFHENSHNKKEMLRSSTRSMNENYVNPMRAVDNVVKYLNDNKAVNQETLGSNRLKTSDGVPIHRGRINSNASQYSQSSSKPRRRLFGLSSSVERPNELHIQRAASENTRIQDSSKILIQNFLGNIRNKNNDGYVLNTENDKSFDSNLYASKGFGKNSRFDLKSNDIRKSHDQINLKRMFSEEPKLKYKLTSYNERRNIRLREKSNNRSEKSVGMDYLPNI